MRRHHLLTYALPVVALAGVGLAAYDANAINPGNPASDTFFAAVNIVSNLLITQTQQLNFGSVTKPNDAGPATYTMSLAGVVTPSANGSAFGSPTAGEFSVTDSAASYSTFSVVGGVCADTEVSLGSMTHNATFVLPAVGIDVAGTLTVTTLATPGGTTCPYTVTAQY